MQSAIKRIYSNLRAGNVQTLFFELVVVALGIFLGLQADQWYENRQDEARREDYLQRLLANIDLDITALVSGIGTASDRLSMTEILYDSIDDNSIALQDPAGYIRALQQVTFKVGYGSSSRSSTYEELVSTGDMRLISTEIRDEIYEYYRAVDDRELAMDSINIVQSESFRRFAGILIMGDLETASEYESKYNAPETLKSRAIAAAERFRNKGEAVEWLAKLAEIHRIELFQANRRLLTAQRLKRVLDLALDS